MQRFLQPGIVYNPIVFPLVQKLLGSDKGGINLLYAGIMWADPQSSDAALPQKWHADGDHCFNVPNLPSHAINVFYNLINVTKEHGATEFVPGTHILGQFNDPTLNNINFSICGEIGSCVIFDYKLKHRGGANTHTNESRPVLYLCYTKNWFRDSGNLRSARSVVTGNAESKTTPWQARILTGRAMPMGLSSRTFVFNDLEKAEHEAEHNKSLSVSPAVVSGSGERYVLFHTDVEFENKTETIIVYSDDVALEVATQFCLVHNLASEMIVCLSDSIQSQIVAATST